MKITKKQLRKLILKEMSDTHLEPIDPLDKYRNYLPSWGTGPEDKPYDAIINNFQLFMNDNDVNMTMALIRKVAMGLEDTAGRFYVKAYAFPGILFSQIAQSQNIASINPEHIKELKNSVFNDLMSAEPAFTIEGGARALALVEMLMNV